MPNDMMGQDMTGGNLDNALKIDNAGQDQQGQDQQTTPDNTFSISDEMLPELLDWEDGKTYSIKLKVKQISRNETDKGSVGTFEIVEASGKTSK